MLPIVSEIACHTAHRRIEIGCCFYSSNAKSCNCSRGRKELFTGGGNLIACGLQAFTSSSNLLHSSGRLICLCLQLFEIFFRFDDLPLKSIVLFFGNVTIRKCLICLLCSSLESSFCFCASSSVLPGSSFKSFSTSLS